MHRLDWDALQVFLAVARGGRISTAARRLGVEHTTVSRRLSALEEELGVPLFYRTTTGYLLTPHGQNVLASAETMETAAIAVAARAREGSGAIAGRVRLALVPEFASHWLAPRLDAFRTLHRKLSCRSSSAPANGTCPGVKPTSRSSLPARVKAAWSPFALPGRRWVCMRRSR
jgi:DNA-binding transcriptional LysR family regulator